TQGAAKDAACDVMEAQRTAAASGGAVGDAERAAVERRGTVDLVHAVIEDAVSVEVQPGSYRHAVATGSRACVAVAGHAAGADGTRLGSGRGGVPNHWYS